MALSFSTVTASPFSYALLNILIRHLLLAQYKNRFIFSRIAFVARAYEQISGFGEGACRFNDLARFGFRFLQRLDALIASTACIRGRAD